MKKLRLGISLIIISWLPFAQLAIYIAHNHQKLTSDSAAESFRLAVWGVQIVIGLIGVWLVGQLAIEAVKRDGWKKTPKNLWQLFRYGPSNEDN